MKYEYESEEKKIAKLLLDYQGTILKTMEASINSLGSEIKLEKRIQELETFIETHGLEVPIASNGEDLAENAIVFRVMELMLGVVKKVERYGSNIDDLHGEAKQALAEYEKLKGE